MAEEHIGERTEQPTPKRKQDARKKGQVPRSRELTTAMILVFSALAFLLFGHWMAGEFFSVSHATWAFTRAAAFDERIAVGLLVAAMRDIFLTVGPSLLMMFLAALAGPILLGGWVFSIESMQFKAERISPLKGFKRMFGAQAAMELLKSIAKFVVVAIIAWLLLTLYFPKLLSLEFLELDQAIPRGIEVVVFVFLGLSASLILIAAIDVPYQLWRHHSQLRMTRQEIKDEFKETEGKPEVKSKIRQIQREIAQRRMMAEVPKADVVITNPEHYSVAIRYDDFGDKAPIVVAKGTDLIALKIREIAVAHNVAIVPAPPLARSLYHSTEIGEEIPRGLYLAVAQVLAYVYQLQTYRRDGGQKPRLSDEWPIPEDLRY
ncbi:MAG: flagellar biosynthesis protein FlhB [Gammaproteobacteria bacterium]|nr:MAG: flagellar biosynthesis protein FlhB [Gammaproteobacteria bacterium]